MPETDTLSRYLRLLSQNKQKLCEEYGLNSIAIFGSLARGDATRISDVDILIEFKDGSATFDNYFGLRIRLEKLLRRKKIDLVIKNSLRDRLRPIIENEAIYV
jgi:predicted nucleotidyltransferase